MARTYAKPHGSNLGQSIKKNRIFYIMLLPVILYYLIFCYGPMAGIVVGFQNYMPRRGILGSEWVGTRHFQLLFGSADFHMILRNTLLLSLYKIVFGFPAPIVLALMINEINNRHFKKVVQTVSYMPHFLSWVIVAKLVSIMLELDGPLNQLLSIFGLEPQQFLINRGMSRGILVAAGIWKEVGWGTLIYLAAIAGINPSLYESALLDGATRWKQTIYITIPSILPTIIVMLVLRMGTVMSAGYEDVLLLQNNMTYDVLETIDTFVYKTGLQNANYSFATAVGIFKSIVSVAAVLITNFIADRATGSSLL